MKKLLLILIIFSCGQPEDIYTPIITKTHYGYWSHPNYARPMREPRTFILGNISGCDFTSMEEVNTWMNDIVVEGDTLLVQRGIEWKEPLSLKQNIFIKGGLK